MPEFEIFLSPKGPILLEGEQRLKIMDSVYKGKSQFGEILSDTGFPKSSTSVTLSKLVEDSMIRTEGEGADKRFYPLAIRMVHSVPTDVMGFLEVMNIWKSNSDVDVFASKRIEFIMIAYLALEFHQNGLSLLPIIIESAKLLAQVAYEKTEDKSYDASVQNICRFFENSVFAEIKPVSVFPPTFDIELVFEMSERTYRSFNDVVIRFITSYLSLTQGITYYASDIKYLSSDGKKVRLTLGFNDVEPEYCNGKYHDIEFDEVSDSDFAIYKVEGSYAPVRGDIQKRIMACLEKHPCSSRDLMGELGEPQTTIIGHLKKMEESKLIMSQKAGNRSIYYMCSEKVLSWKRPADTRSFTGKKYLEKMWENPAYITKQYMSFLVVDSYELGFDISAVMSYLGRRIGEFVTTIFPSITAESLMNALQNYSKFVTSSEIVVKSYNPPTIVKVSDYDMEPAIADAQRMLYNALFAEIFGKLMHIKYVVQNDSISGEGCRRYEASFVPKLN